MPELILNQILEHQADWTVLSRRQARETRREVYKYDNRYVIKRFILPAALTRYRRPWKMEHRALLRLKHEDTPRSLGWKEAVENGERVISYVREFRPGTAVKALTREQLPDVADCFVQLHRNGVITDDANLQNFIQDLSGKLHFIDFGRARLVPPRSLRLYFHVGEEFAKFIREGLGWDRELWQVFKQAYYHKAGHGSLARTLIQGSYFGHCRMRRLRKILSGRPANS